MDTIRSVNPNPTGNAVVANSPAPARPAALPATQRVNPAASAAPARLAANPGGRGLPAWDSELQSEVTRAQQALDYLERLQAQLESIKVDLSARLSGARGGRQVEARIRQLGATLDARRKNAGDGVGADLDFSASRPASQRFRIGGLDIGTLRAAGPQTIALSVGDGPQVTVSLDPDMTPDEVARRFDRALAPLNVHAGLDKGGELVFSTAEKDYAAVAQNFVIAGRGHATVQAQQDDALSAENLETGNVEAMRQSLREVVQALARVRRSIEAASAALSQAMTRAATANIPPPAEAQVIATEFVNTASNTDYDSLIAITSALVGVSRERVLALLGLR